jgi:redox-sensitive bicupin YhaK (pirin superfamily)
VTAGRHGSSSAPCSATRRPVETHTPLLGAEITLAEGTTLEIPVDPSYEHGVLVDTGALTLDDTSVKPSQLAFVPVGSDRLVLHASDETRLLLLGGTPLGERIVMWWNFVGRDHDEIAEYRRQWQALLAGEDQDRFALPDDDRYPRSRAGAAARGAAHAARVRRGPGLSPRAN